MATIVGILRAIGIVPSSTGMSLYSEIDRAKTLVGTIDVSSLGLTSIIDGTVSLVSVIVTGE